MSAEETTPTVEDISLDGLKKKKKSKTTSEPTTDSTDATGEDDLFGGLKKKKKKKSKDSAKEKTGTEELEDGIEDLGLGPKKKKSTKKKKADSSFDKELEKAGLSSTTAEAESSNTESTIATEVGLSYEDLLERFFTVLKTNNPELAGERSGVRLKIPPPIVAREPKKTIFSNVKDISQKLQRDPEHVIQYLFAELGTSGSIDGKEQLIIKGKFMQKQLEYVLKKYILEYVTCQTCRSINTKLVRENANRLYFMVCNSCGSTRSVSSIKTGFQAAVGRRKRTG
ncbi:translation initiation factor eIF2 subunit beta [Saccharomycopsis crataegensis]|uniref:Translation initiation factor eIF2 subunit beta n=1 Tax=Saccharomycopsis crataegensis TaxID=43959 RepID=A0AAV5QI69_9ASCO|nr:translation initiation factor eIF2 subunit beta [Saccharomycopsis crataegensis]